MVPAVASPARVPWPFGRALAVARRLLARAGARAGACAVAQGQAYCGPVHGQRWDVDRDQPAVAVTVTGPTIAPVHYRLARDPRTLQPARDPRGRYVYVPVRYDPVPRRHGAPAGSPSYAGSVG